MWIGITLNLAQDHAALAECCEPLVDLSGVFLLDVSKLIGHADVKLVKALHCLFKFVNNLVKLMHLVKVHHLKNLVNQFKCRQSIFDVFH